MDVFVKRKDVIVEKEYIERKDAKKTMCRMCEGGAKLVCGTLNDCCTTMRIFDHIPAADVRPVVTCGECIYAPSGDGWGFDLEWPHDEWPENNPCPWK